MADRFKSLRDATSEAVLRGRGHVLPAVRQALARGEVPDDAPAGLRALVDKIRRTPYRVTDEDIAAVVGPYTEDQVFELVVATVLGAAEERVRAGLKALEDA